MYKKISLSILAAMTCFSSMVFAMPPKPAKCPGIPSIKSAGLAYAAPDAGRYVVAQMSKYDTTDTWIFAFINIPATSTAEAITKGNELLSTLSGAPVPYAVESQNVWACMYLTSQSGTYGIAFTPVNSSAKVGDTLKAVPR